MIEAKWSPEPWRDDDGTWMWDAEGKAHWLDVGGDRSSEDRRRIIACVNACAGIPTEALERGDLAKALELLASGAVSEAVMGPSAAGNVLRALGMVK